MTSTAWLICWCRKIQVQTMVKIWLGPGKRGHGCALARARVGVLEGRALLVLVSTRASAITIEETASASAELQRKQWLKVSRRHLNHHHHRVSLC